MIKLGTSYIFFILVKMQSCQQFVNNIFKLSFFRSTTRRLFGRRSWLFTLLHRRQGNLGVGGYKTAIAHIDGGIGGDAGVHDTGGDTTGHTAFTILISRTSISRTRTKLVRIVTWKPDSRDVAEVCDVFIMLTKFPLEGDSKSQEDEDCKSVVIGLSEPLRKEPDLDLRISYQTI